MYFSTCTISLSRVIQNKSQQPKRRNIRTRKLYPILFVRLAILVRLKSNQLRSTNESVRIFDAVNRPTTVSYRRTIDNLILGCNGGKFAVISFDFDIAFLATFHCTPGVSIFRSHFARSNIYQYLIKTLMENNMSALDAKVSMLQIEHFIFHFCFVIEKTDICQMGARRSGGGDAESEECNRHHFTLPSSNLLSKIQYGYESFPTIFYFIL